MVKIYYDPNSNGFYLIQHDNGPVDKVNALDKEAVGTGGNNVIIRFRENLQVLNNLPYDVIALENGNPAGANVAEVLAYLNGFLGGVPSESNEGGPSNPVQNNYSTSEVALQNPDGTPLKWTDGKQVYRRVFEYGLLTEVPSTLLSGLGKVISLKYQYKDAGAGFYFVSSTPPTAGGGISITESSGQYALNFAGGTLDGVSDITIVCEYTKAGDSPIP